MAVTAIHFADLTELLFIMNHHGFHRSESFLSSGSGCVLHGKPLPFCRLRLQSAPSRTGGGVPVQAKSGQTVYSHGFAAFGKHASDESSITLFWYCEYYQIRNILYNQMTGYCIDREAAEPAYMQLYRLLLTDIAGGRFAPGSRLPSKRELAAETGVSVITAEHAYAMLCDEGYASARERSGIYVSAGEAQMVALPPAARLPARTENGASGTAGADFPFASFAKAMRRVLSIYGAAILEKAPYHGCQVLRRTIAGYLLRFRGMRVSPEQIVVGAGAEYLYGLLVQLLGRERKYGIEEPSYEKIRQVYTANGVQVLTLKLEGDGIPARTLAESRAEILHVTPYHSFPSGVSASASRRMEYLRWAEQNDAMIIEDDYESEFAVFHKPAETIFSMDRTGRVIYLNTFSKTLAPSVRVGYMLLPPALSELFRQRLGFYSCTVPVFDQYVLAEFIESGEFERHINRMRRSFRAAQCLARREEKQGRTR